MLTTDETVTVTATVSTVRDGWDSVRQVPTFMLSRRVQGITSLEHAARVAADVMASVPLVYGARLSIGLSCGPESFGATFAINADGRPERVG